MIKANNESVRFAVETMMINYITTSTHNKIENEIIKKKEQYNDEQIQH